MSTKEQLVNAIESMKGVAGSGNVLGNFFSRVGDFLTTLEPGDIVGSNLPSPSAAPIGYDLWYLWSNNNFMEEYYNDRDAANPVIIDGDHQDYRDYISENLSFLKDLDVKPLRVYKDLASQLTENVYFDVYDMKMKSEWSSNGIYWINTMVFELCNKDISVQFTTAGSVDSRRSPDDYVGYISFPVGQLGVMEVISLLRETVLSGYKFAAVDAKNSYYSKEPFELEDTDKATVPNPPDIFPPDSDINGCKLVGKNYCFGDHLVRSAYLSNKDTTELFVKQEGHEDVRPKKWIRYWIHKDSFFPVPGEFLGILCRPVSAPPHVWWFQESSPLLYAGNWVETKTLTSGVILSITLENDRADGGIGNLYKIKLQGCKIEIASTDFFTYSVGDRVAIVKVDGVESSFAEKSYTWAGQYKFRKVDVEEEAIITNYAILPITFYKLI